MNSRGWWWQRLHPALRGVLAVAYFGIAIAIFVFAVTPSFHSDPAGPTNDTQVSEPVTTDVTTDTEPPSTEPADTAVLTGAELYAANCSSCHGSSLEGGAGPKLGAGSDASEEIDSRITALIHDGKGTMPPFGETLTDDQIQLIVEFLRESQNG